MADFADDELPLPPFVEVFGDGGSDTILVANNAALARRRMVSNRKGSTLPGGRHSSVAVDESSGRWTPEEQRLFLEGLMLYGKDWKKMAPLIKTRTLVQIRTHAQKVFKKMGLRMLDVNTKKKIGLKRSIDDVNSEEGDDEPIAKKQSGQIEGGSESNDNTDDGEQIRTGGMNAHQAAIAMQAHQIAQQPTMRTAVPLPPHMPFDEDPAAALLRNNQAANRAPVTNAAHQFMLQQQAQQQAQYQIQLQQQQQAALHHQALQQQEFLRQQQQFILHQQMQHEEYQRQLAYQQQQQQLYGQHNPNGNGL